MITLLTLLRRAPITPLCVYIIIFYFCCQDFTLKFYNYFLTKKFKLFYKRRTGALLSACSRKKDKIIVQKLLLLLRKLITFYLKYTVDSRYAIYDCIVCLVVCFNDCVSYITLRTVCKVLDVNICRSESGCNL